MKEHEHHEGMEMNGHHHDEPLEDAEIKSWNRKTIWSWIFAIPIAILMLSERILGISLVPESYLVFVLPLATASTYFPVVKKAIIIAATPE